LKPFWQPEEQRKNVLGAEYERIVNEAVIAQITQKEQETGVEFWNAEEGGFDGITEETDFYLNEAGAPVVVFAPYEIAPEAAETVEFVIK